MTSSGGPATGADGSVDGDLATRIRLLRDQVAAGEAEQIVSIRPPRPTTLADLASLGRPRAMPRLGPGRPHNYILVPPSTPSGEWTASVLVDVEADGDLVTEVRVRRDRSDLYADLDDWR